MCLGELGVKGASEARELEEEAHRARWEVEGRYPNNDYPEPTIAIRTTRRWGGNQHWDEEKGGGEEQRIREQLREEERERMEGARRYQERQDKSRGRGKKTRDAAEHIATTGILGSRKTAGKKTTAHKNKIPTQTMRVGDN